MSASTAPAERMFEVSDGDPIPFPTVCVEWCDRAGHLAYAEESAGHYPAYDVAAHFRYGGDDYLDEIRNSGTGAIMRDGGASWNLYARQYVLDPREPLSGYASPPLVELTIADRGIGTQASIPMTTGEARVLIAHLSALVDAVDLPRPPAAH